MTSSKQALNSIIITPGKIYCVCENHERFIHVHYAMAFIPSCRMNLEVGDYLCSYVVMLYKNSPNVFVVSHRTSNV
jgi:hypothetical protein